MKRKIKLAALLAAPVVVLGVAAATVPSIAQDEQPEPIAVEFLTPRSEFTDDVRAQLKVTLEGDTGKKKTKPLVLNMRDPGLTVVAKITVQPGAQFPWHTHPGPVIVNVAQGELVYVQASDCLQRPYPAGTAFIDPGRGNVHTAFNPTDAETVIVATFFEAPAEGPLTIPADPPADCQIEAGAHGSH